MKTHEIQNAKILRESEKALFIEVTFGDEFKKAVWFPRSQVSIEGDKIFATAWILGAKADEIGSHCPNIAIASVRKN